MSEWAVFAGGCFWCIVKPFDQYDGVLKVVSGYTGGKTKNPTYEQVKKKDTGHLEAIKVFYDEKRISYETLLDVFWKTIDPTDESGQFFDRGSNYKSAIFYHNESQKNLAEKSKSDLNASGIYSLPIATPIIPECEFYEAEEYHQNFYKKHLSSFNEELDASGRLKYQLNIKKTWLRKKLSPLQYEVTQECKTEPPFTTDYCTNKEKGVYIDINDKVPLFISSHQVYLNNGYPTFSKLIKDESCIEIININNQTEIHSKIGNSHIGIKSLDNMYIVNASALIFIPENEMESKGYAYYKQFI